MQLFKLKTRLSKFDHFADFAREFKLSEHDLVITNEFLSESPLSFHYAGEVRFRRTIG